MSGHRYLSDRFEWAAPGDRQEDAWLIRFCDKDFREAIFTGPDAESEAWEHWNRYSPAFNIYTFRLARLSPDTQKQALVEALEAMIAWANGGGAGTGYPGTQAAAALAKARGDQ